MSGVSSADQEATQREGDNSFGEYGFEYEPGDDGYVLWTSAGKPSWKVFSEALAADGVMQISKRTISGEPLYLILNLGLSQGFGTIHWPEMEFPYVMSVDWVRVYQRQDSQNVGCDPPEYPTKVRAQFRRT